MLGGFSVSVCNLSRVLFERPRGSRHVVGEELHSIPTFPLVSLTEPVSPTWLYGLSCVSLPTWSRHLCPGHRSPEGVHAVDGGQSRMHPVAILMRFFLGFDGVPVVLPLLQRPASAEPWRAIRGSCPWPHKLSAYDTGCGGRQLRKPRGLVGLSHNHIQIHVICTLMYPFVFKL